MIKKGTLMGNLDRGEMVPVSQEMSLHRVEAGAFLIKEKVHARTSFLPSHVHELTTLGILLNGTCVENINGRTTACGQYDILITPGGESHALTYGHVGAHWLSIEIQCSRTPSLSISTKFFQRAECVTMRSIRPLALRIQRELRIGDSAAALSIEGLVLEMLAQLIRDNIKHPASYEPHWLREARAFVRENFCRQISLSTIAAAVGTSPAHLARVFRQTYNCTVGEYLRQVRLEYASVELADRAKSIADVATGAGFYDQSHFTRLFKKRYGITPGDFRSPS